jgi:leucyl aminopeptidase
MNFDVSSKALADVDAACLLLGVHEDTSLTAEAAAIDRRCGGRLSRALRRGDFSAKLGESWLITDLAGVKAERVLLVGVGPKGEIARKSWRQALVGAVTATLRTQIASIAIGLPRPATKAVSDELYGRSVAELIGQSLYRVNDLKTGKKPKAAALTRVVVSVRTPAAAAVQRGLEQGAGLAAGARVMRDLANLPANVCTPRYLAKQAEELAAAHKSVTAKILGLDEIKREKMGCFLAVTQGSDEPPRFIVLEHKSSRAKHKAPIVLVGKGITFDTGGISLKDPPAMDEMKFDMSGAAAVLGALTTVATLNLPLNVVGLVAACENMPSGRAIKPGDIVTSASGQTVEILNTDAEGRLILCDALHYARRFEPAAVVDLATLTGAIVIALGSHHTGVFANDDALARELVGCGLAADDRGWHMPIGDEYFEGLKSNFADMANVAGRDGGAAVAATFLSRYTQGMKWAHLDIAATAYAGGAKKGSTGRPIPLLTEFLLRRAAAR